MSRNLDLMIDLETLGTRSDAVILSIGAVEFDIFQNQLGSEFYVNIDTESCLTFGLTMDERTINWWKTQSNAAKNALAYPVPVSLMNGLMMLSEFMYGKKYCVWGNGPAFDNIILKNAFRAVNLKCPWLYRNDRCFRTIKSIHNTVFPHVSIEVELEGVKHNALYDAKVQAMYTLKVFELLKGCNNEKTM